MSRYPVYVQGHVIRLGMQLLQCFTTLTALLTVAACLDTLVVLCGMKDRYSAAASKSLDG
jgi:hypothetical protein